MMYIESRESEQNWLKREESMTKLRSFEIAKNKALEHELNTIEKINEVLRESREDLEGFRSLRCFYALPSDTGETKPFPFNVGNGALPFNREGGEGSETTNGFGRCAPSLGLKGSEAALQGQRAVQLAAEASLLLLPNFYRQSNEPPEPLAALESDLSPISPDSGDSEDSAPSEQGAQPATLAASSFSLSAAIEIFTDQGQNENVFPRHLILIPIDDVSVSENSSPRGRQSLSDFKVVEEQYPSIPKHLYNTAKSLRNFLDKDLTACLVKGHVVFYPQWLSKLKTVQPVAAIKPNNLDYAVEIIAAAATLSQSHICNPLNDVSFPETFHAMLCRKGSALPCEGAG
ncbi:uncharacterized protein CCOS01_16407 [Colletotrichum costaricense]|uniref:Uncharacterized protein n=1 Tax=Colletotrichum costaricense TaxID=1209916 RepID=A0AAI9YFP2_9PEZI|nr:uncharacterized protein CCOS01_16407 [Colletotrichum costaricense]KAK1506548.1 hypothetical protein CCOS01_16407 [Colletotrichum costaricense]